MEQSQDSANHNKSISKERLDIYNGNETGIDKNTGLLTSQSLNRSLYQYLQLNDNNWVLAMLDVDGLASINEKLGYDGANHKITEIGRVIAAFCQKNPQKLKGYKCSEVVTGKGDLFGVLMKCNQGKLKHSELYIKKLMKKITTLTGETVSVGIAKMKEWETYNQWKLRAYKNIAKVKETGKGSDDYYSDIDVKFVKKAIAKQESKENINSSDEKTKEFEKKTIKKKRRLGTKKEFEEKIQEIANKEDKDWVVAVMDIDDLGEFLFQHGNDRALVKPEIVKLETAMVELFNDIEYSTESHYFGYNLTNGDEYGIILYDSKDISKCCVSAYDVLEGLRLRICDKCAFTVSIGYSRIIEDDLGMPDDLFERVNNHLKAAKKNGKNMVHFGQTKDLLSDIKDSDEDDDDDHDSGIGNDIDNTTQLKRGMKTVNAPSIVNEDDDIERQSLKRIEVCFLIFLFRFFAIALFYLCCLFFQTYFLS